MEIDFSNKDACVIPLLDYLRCCGIGPAQSNPAEPSVQLPPIQRGSVWKVAQVERLWDSLLRGFPIGSFLLAPRGKDQLAHTTESEHQQKSKMSGWYLLDGQQRLRSLMLGFPSFRDSMNVARLWIDLFPPPLAHNANYNDRMFLLRLLTRSQPWGRDDKNPDERIKEDQKFAQRQKLLGEGQHYDYQVGIDTRPWDGPGWQPDACKSWPLQARCAVPLDALISLCGGSSGQYRKPSLETVLQLRHPQVKALSDDECATASRHLDYILAGLERLLSEQSGMRTMVALQRLDPSADPFAEYLKMAHNQQGHKTLDVQDAMEVLFRRTNAGGTPLAGEEMAFSLLKARWGEAYDLVNNIVRDEAVGYLLSPSAMVLAATRLALPRTLNAEGNPRADVVRPSVGDFRQWIGTRSSPGDMAEGTFIYAMHEMLGGHGRSSRFHAAISCLCKTVLYLESSDRSDPGLPRSLLLAVKPAILNPVLLWLDRQDSDETIAANSRLPILRYLLFSLVGLIEDIKASRTAMNLIREQSFPVFPDAEIYQRWRAAEETKNPVVMALPKPDEFALPFDDADGLLRPWSTLFGMPVPFYEFRRAFWERRELLLWFQRAWLPGWFAGYNPMRDDDADTPYDYDHILPRAHLMVSGTSPKTGLAGNKAENDRFLNSRGIYLDSIGNNRIWPGWANRSDGALGPAEKLRLNRSEPDSVDQQLGFAANDFLAASAISESHRSLWMKASGPALVWDAERRQAWQTAVERRAAGLYEILYATLGFSRWR